MALRRLLVSPDLSETAWNQRRCSTEFMISHWRLSFFLWSSIPDEELLVAAESGTLSDPAELTRQSRGCSPTLGRRP